MQRIEMEIQGENNIAVFFFDPTSEKIDHGLRNAYNQLWAMGDFIKNYTHVTDSLCFEYSHHSCGIQLADYCAGVFNGVLKGYPTAKKIFSESIRPLVRKKGNVIMGHGIIEILKNDDVRNQIRQLL